MQWEQLQYSYYIVPTLVQPSIKVTSESQYQIFLDQSNPL